jgi:hypothetical protein
LLLELAHPIDARLVCTLQRLVVHGADLKPLLVRPSLVVGALSERLSLLHRKESTLAAMMAIFFLRCTRLLLSQSIILTSNVC